MPEQKKEVRQMPWSQDAEKGFLGSILLAPSRVMDEHPWIRPEHFYHPAHAAIYEELLAMREKRKPIDQISVTQWLEDRHLLEEVGGAAGVTELFTFVPTASNAAYYAGIINEKATRRGIIEACATMSDAAYLEGHVSPEEMLEACETQLVMLRKDATYQDAMKPIKDAVPRVVEELKTVYDNRGEGVGLKTGFHDFDRMSGGLKAGQMMVVAARPSVGKSAMAMQLATYFSYQKPVAVFSLEMSTDSLVRRLICNGANLDLRATRDGFMSARARESLDKVGEEIASYPIFIDETGELTILDWRARARRVKQKHNVEVIVIDYLQRLSSPSAQGKENRTQEVREVSLAVTAMAKQLDVLMVVCAQLSRDADTRLEPKLSDLKESGQIEQDADIVWLLQRQGERERERMDKDEGALYDKINAHIREDKDKKDLMRVHVAKHRDNPTGVVRLWFEKKFTRFLNITETLYSNDAAKRQKISGRKKKQEEEKHVEPDENGSEGSSDD